MAEGRIDEKTRSFLGQILVSHHAPRDPLRDERLRRRWRPQTYWRPRCDERRYRIGRTR